MATENPGAISGKDGDAFKSGVRICEMSSWSFKASVATHAYSSNCSGGSKKRVAGIKDAVGSLKVLWNPGVPCYGQGSGQMQEGDTADLGLYLDDYQYLTVTAIIASFAFEVDIEEGALVSSDIEFEANGPWQSFFLEESSMSSSSSSSSSGSSSSSS